MIVFCLKYSRDIFEDFLYMHLKDAAQDNKMGNIERPYNFEETLHFKASFFFMATHRQRLGSFIESASVCASFRLKKNVTFHNPSSEVALLGVHFCPLQDS